MWYAVVGNGPSACDEQTAELVDACQFVVRINQWRLHFPNGEAGSRCDAWAHYGSRSYLEREGVLPRGLYEVWFTQPSHRSEMGSPNQPSLKAAKEYAEHRVVQPVDDRTWWAVTERLRAEAASDEVRPTTGLTALAMALVDGPEGIVLTGFDATTHDRPGWGDNREVEPWRVVPTHDHVAEKHLIAELADQGFWLGAPTRTKLRWLGRPHF